MTVARLRPFVFHLGLLPLLMLLPVAAWGRPAGTCPRYPAGSTLVPPVDLYSQNGVLTVDLTYQGRSRR